MDDDQTPTDTTKFGAAAPLVDPLAKAYDKVRSIFKNVPGKAAPPQTNTGGGADPGMVNEANESFRKAAQKIDTQPTGKTPTTRKVLRKAPTKR